MSCKIFPKYYLQIRTNYLPTVSYSLQRTGQNKQRHSFEFNLYIKSGCFNSSIVGCLINTGMNIVRNQGNLTSSCRPNSGGIKEN